MAVRSVNQVAADVVQLLDEKGTEKGSHPTDTAYCWEISQCQLEIRLAKAKERTPRTEPGSASCGLVAPTILR